MKETYPNQGFQSFVLSSRGCVHARHKCGKRARPQAPCLVRLMEDPQCTRALTGTAREQHREQSEGMKRQAGGWGWGGEGRTPLT